MRRLASLLILLTTLTAFAEEAPAPAPAPEIPKKAIELEWDKVEDAGSYEVKLTPAGGGEPLTFATPDNHLNQEVPIGNYDLQVRAKSSDGSDFSPWSEKMPVAIVSKELMPLNPPDGATVDGHAVNKQTIEFRWSAVDKIKLYTLSVWNDERKDNPWVFTTKETSKKIDVPPAEVYHWKVTFASADDVLYQQQPKTFSFTLLGSSLLTPEIETKIPPLKWKPVPQATEYEAVLSFHYLDEEEWKVIKTVKQPETELKIEKLKPGAYKLAVTAHAPKHMPSETAESEFFVKPTQPELEHALASINSK